MSSAKQLKPNYKRPSKLNVRKHLHMDAMLSALYKGFCALPDHRRGKVGHSPYYQQVLGAAIVHPDFKDRHVTSKIGAIIRTFFY